MLLRLLVLVLVLAVLAVPLLVLVLGARIGFRRGEGGVMYVWAVDAFSDMIVGGCEGK